MKAIFLATAVVMLAASSAGAADLAVPYQPAPRPACAQFGGFYVGANVGAAYHTAHRNDDDGYFIDNSGHTTYGTGWAVGAQAGYNLQRGCTVFGVEIDWDWASVKSQFQDDPNAPGATLTIDSKLKSFGTARTRTGIVIDDVMIYLTGGLAWGNVENTYTRFFGAPFNELNALSSTRWGWTAGAGSEWKLAGNWSLKSEVLYIQLKQQYDTFYSPAFGTNVRFTNNDSVITARWGLNYIFGASPY